MKNRLKFIGLLAAASMLLAGCSSTDSGSSIVTVDKCPYGIKNIEFEGSQAITFDEFTLVSSFDQELYILPVETHDALYSMDPTYQVLFENLKLDTATDIASFFSGDGEFMSKFLIETKEGVYPFDDSVMRFLKLYTFQNMMAENINGKMTWWSYMWLTPVGANYSWTIQKSVEGYYTFFFKFHHDDFMECQIQGDFAIICLLRALGGEDPVNFVNTELYEYEGEYDIEEPVLNLRTGEKSQLLNYDI